jgi:ATP-dependent 26S proteasome regulatory subunit
LFASNLSPELHSKLLRLDRLIEREILRLRSRYQLSLDEFRGLYVSDEQVDQLVRATITDPQLEQSLFVLSGEARATNAGAADPRSVWGTLASRFGLEPLELDLITLALAPEIDLKYETLYAYLNNDITRKWPTLELAQRLLSDDVGRVSAIAAAVSPAGRLIRLGIFDLIDPPSGRPSRLNVGFAATPLITQFVLGLPLADPRLSGFAEVAGRLDGDAVLAMDRRRGALIDRLATIYRSAGDKAATIVLLGERGSGRQDAAAELCEQLGMPLLRLDLGALRYPSEAIPGIASALALYRRLRPCGLYLDGLHALRNVSDQAPTDGVRLLDLLQRQPSPIFAACEPHTNWHELLRSRRTLVIRLDEADYPHRLALWERELARAGIDLPIADCRRLADRLPFSPGQIEETISTACDLTALADSSRVDVATLVAAARQHTDHRIGNLALKVESRHSWDELVLPAATRMRVQELASAISNRHVVYEEWGFARRITIGTGLKVLFSGASGTGKTMTAGVIAHDLGFDLYKIELSGVVSKYIGETEKNLDRIFRAVRAANAMLFIDEAEAILGKRSEVKDAHDRYANIEVAYLLQKLEDHDGVVILASNLKRNIDDAFARRMHYVIDFPLPDERDRKRLWRGMFPREAPIGDDVDFDFLAKQFELAGGDIRNVALDAAFLAAQNGRAITMKQLVQALARQLAKQGKIPSLAEFQQFHPLIAQWAVGSEE